ncbi:MAG: CBS domain-containing protein [Candidatus Woesearchaeota archaeon]
MNYRDNYVSKWMTKKTVDISPKTTIFYAAKLMKQKDIGSLLITEKGKLLGILTDTDIIQKVLASEKKSDKTRASQIMTSKIISITEDFTLLDAIELIFKKKIKRLPVISIHGQLKGIITEVDIMRALSKIGRISELINIIHHLLTHKDTIKGKKVMEVGYWMSRNTKIIHEHETIETATKLMKQHNCGSLPVVNCKDDIIGIITDTDIIHKVVAMNLDPKKIIVEKIMTKNVLITTPQKNIIKVAEIMHKKKIRRIPVMQDTKIIGIIASIDLINALFSINNYEQAKELIDVMYKI